MLLFRKLRDSHMGQEEYCPIHPLSPFLPEPLPGLSIYMHLPPSLMPQRVRAVLQDGTLVTLASIPRSGCPSLCSQQQRPTSWVPAVTCVDEEEQSKPTSATKYHLPQHCQRQWLLKRRVSGHTPIVTAISGEYCSRFTILQMQKLRPEKGHLFQEHTRLPSPLLKSS